MILFHPTQDASINAQLSARAKVLLQPNPYLNESANQNEWYSNKFVGTYGQIKLVTQTSAEIYRWSTSTNFYQPLLNTFSSNGEGPARFKAVPTDTSFAEIDRPLIGVLLTASTDGLRDRAQLMAPYSYCSTWTIKVPVVTPLSAQCY